MPITCDNTNSSTLELLMMCFRQGDDGSAVLDFVPVDVDDPCVLFIDCDKTNIGTETLIRKLLINRSPGCWAIRNYQIPGNITTCHNYFTCDNINEGTETALRKAISIDTDGNPVLVTTLARNANPYTCDDNPMPVSLEEILRGLFAVSDEGCVSVRVYGNDADDCSSWPVCDRTGSLETAIRSAIVNAGSCPAFFFISSPVNPPGCNLDLLDAALTVCQSTDMYMWVLSNDGDNSFTGIEFHFYYDNGSGWVEFSPGITNGRSDPLPFVDAQYKVVMICNGDSKEIVFNIIGMIFFQYYINYQINAGVILSGDSNEWYYVAETDTITLRSLDPNAHGYWYLTVPSRLLASNTQSVTVSFSDALNDGNGLYQCNFDISIVDALETGCSTGSVFKIQYVPNPVITDDQNAFICSGSDLLLTARFGALNPFAYQSYQWYKDNVLIGGATSATYTATVAGTYKVVCTYHGITVTSSDHAVTVQTQLPEPVLTNDLTGNYIVHGSMTYIESNSPGFRIQISDNNFYAGGYPAGTTVRIPFYVDPAMSIVDFNAGVGDKNLINVGDNYTVIVCLPASLGGCCAQVTFSTDFVSMQAPQIQGGVDTACSGGLPVAPDGGTYWIDNGAFTCLADGKIQWVIGSQVSFIYSLDLTTPGQVTITSDFTMPDAGVPLDMSNAIRWYKLYDLLTDTWLPVPALVQSGGISLVVTEAGVYGAQSQSAVYPTINVGFGYINFVVPSIP